MRTWVLGSGSRGNAVVVECGDGAHILIDAGFPPSILARRLAAAGIAPEAIEAVVITHEHTDHMRGAAAAARKWGWALYATAGTVAEWPGIADADVDVRAFEPGGRLTLGCADIETVAVSHDAAEPVAVVVTARKTGSRTAIAYDLGQVDQPLRRMLRDIDVLVLEANHDSGMLRTGPYPVSVQRRIASRTGHLSNDAAARLARDCTAAGLGELVLAHLSANCNEARVALGTVADALAPTAWRGRVHIAPQDEVAGPFIGRSRRVSHVQLALGL
jgi:phosphoribosyl 1,2-cyclic phosphodiesterase